MNKQIQMTKSGFDALKAELEELSKNKRPRLVERLEDARNAGDLSENSDYTNAKEELEFLDGRLDELSQVVENAQVISGKVSTSKVSVGTTVKVKVNGDDRVFNIVGEWEADPMKQKISYESPLGQALVGKKVGDTVEIEAPAGKVTYKILSIE